MALVALTAALLLAACVPPSPAEPRWSGTRLERDTTADPAVNRVGAWTNEEWFATVEPPSGGGGSAELAIYPRTGKGGSVLGAPQRLSVPTSSLLGPYGENVIGVNTGTDALFFRESGGVWQAAGSLPIDESAGYQLAAMTDDWAVVRRQPAWTGSGDGEVRVHALDTAGPTITATLVATLGPDPSWPDALRNGFGQVVSLDGDLLAVSGVSINDVGPGGLRIFRATGGNWAPVQSLGGSPDTPQSFARTHAIDDGPTVDRLVLAPSYADPTEFHIEIHADSGAGFALEQSIPYDPDAPDEMNGLLFGYALAIDGDRMAFTSRGVLVPSADPTHDPVEVGHVEVHRLRSDWAFEAELDIFVSPFDEGVRRAFPNTLKLVGDHLAVGVLMTLDPPPGCIFPCLASIGAEAWSFTRA